MSRAYNLCVKTVGISKRQLSKVVKKQFGWDGEVESFQNIVYFCGDGCLCGGTDEQSAHSQIYAALKAINPKARIITEWTCMEELPVNSYGDDKEIN